MFIIPLDTVKSRVQADNPNNPIYKGMIDCFVKTYNEGGYYIFLRGTKVIFIRTIPLNATIFVAYEHSLKIMDYLFTLWPF